MAKPKRRRRKPGPATKSKTRTPAPPAPSAPPAARAPERAAARPSCSSSGPGARPLVAQALPFALLACACGAAVLGVPATGERARGHGAQPAPASSVASAAAAAAAARTSPSGAVSAPPLPGFEALEGRGAALAPGMRVAARKQSAGGERVEIVRAEGRDACVRIAFESTRPVRAELVDGSGRVLASTRGASNDGVLGEHGPVCIRKGDLVAGIASPPGSPDASPPDGGGAQGDAAARVRWVAWEAL